MSIIIERYGEVLHTQYHASSIEPSLLLPRPLRCGSLASPPKTQVEVLAEHHLLFTF